MSNHSQNCTCVNCTGNDPYIGRLRARWGANSHNNIMNFAARPGVYGTNHADSPIQTISVPKPADTVVQNKSKQWLDTLGALALDALGTIMDKQAKGEALPPALEQIGATGNQVIKSGTQAGINQGEEILGEKIVKFAPFIVIGVLALVGTLIFFIGKKG